MLDETTASHTGGIAEQHGRFTVYGHLIPAVHHCMQLMLRVDRHQPVIFRTLRWTSHALQAVAGPAMVSGKR